MVAGEKHEVQSLHVIFVGAKRAVHPVTPNSTLTPLHWFACFHPYKHCRTQAGTYEESALYDAPQLSTPFHHFEELPFSEEHFPSAHKNNQYYFW